MTRTVTVLAAVLALTTGAPARAATLLVANNGLDGAACGTKDAPCRSITRAIANAVAGDKIVVGPGRYGDLDRDGTFGEPNEEGPTVGVVVLVDKAVTIESSDGPAATVIDAADASVDVVRVVASGARFGKAKKGFTLFAADRDGVAVNGTAAGVVVAGNLAVATGSGFSLSSDGAANVLDGNVASACVIGVSLGLDGGTLTRSTLAIASEQSGFDLSGSGHRLEGTVATASDDFGYTAGLYSGVAIVGGAAIGNRQGVFGGNGSDLTITGFAALANRQAGVHNQGTTGMTMTASNFAGNGSAGLGGSFNCGTLNENLPLVATNVFWSAATGPGGDPADDVCDLGTGVTTVAPFATKPFKVKTRVPQP